MLPLIWLERIRLLQQRLDGENAGVESALRHAFHLSILAPDTFRAVIGDIPSEAEYEGLLDAGDFDEAARHLVTSASIEIEVAVPDGHAIARVSCAVFDVASEAIATHEAQALLLAWLRLLDEIAKSAQDETPKFQHPILHKHRSARRQQSSEH